MRVGPYISGAGHAALAVFVLFGDVVGHDVVPPAQVAEVRLVSPEDFAALTRPEQGEAAPAAESAPPPPEEPALAEDPEPAEQPAPPDTAAAQAPPAAPEPAQDAPDSGEPTPQEAPRVAPEVAEAPPPDAETAPQVTERTAPVPDSAQVVEEQAPTAPEEATTEIVTEAEEPASSALGSSPRPQNRPQRQAALEPQQPQSFEASSLPDEPEPQPEPEPDPQPEPDPEPEPEPQQVDPDMSDAIAQALAEANSAETAPQTGAPAGPPMTSGERDALRVAVQECWNVGALSSDALSTSVVVSVRMTRDAMPDTASIRMEGYQGGDEAAARQAFEAARRAIIRCGSSGFPLPTEKYDQWAEIEMTFNPENMRIR